MFNKSIYIGYLARAMLSDNFINFIVFREKMREIYFIDSQLLNSQNIR